LPFSPPKSSLPESRQLVKGLFENGRETIGMSVSYSVEIKLTKSQTFNKAVAEALEDWATEVVAYIKEKMQEPKTGHNYGYKRSYDGQVYIASAPGEYPGIKTGELINDIQVTESMISASGGGGYTGVQEVFITSDVPHAGILNDPDYIHSRPWLERAFSENESRYTEILNDKLQKYGMM
jgi:hypothetical protein